jgi:hypothetical protein
MSTNSEKDRIRKIKRQISRLGPLRPGTLYSRYSVCGKSGCRCARKRNPQKHGPYHYLSYTFGGKSYTEFVPADRLEQVRQQVSNYNRLMQLVKELVAVSIEAASKPSG